MEGFARCDFGIKLQAQKEEQMTQTIQTNHGTREACQEAAINQLSSGIKGDQWMIAVFSVNGDVVTLEETTFNFAARHHHATMSLLDNALRSKLPLLSRPVEHEELPMAKHLQNGGENHEVAP